MNDSLISRNILNLARTNRIVKRAIQAYYGGHMTYVQALEDAVITLAYRNKTLEQLHGPDNLQSDPPVRLSND